MPDHDMPSLEQIEQQEAVERALRWVTVTVDMFVLDNQIMRPTREITPADKVRLIQEATLGYLVGHDMIVVKDSDQVPFLLPNGIPEHLVPDVEDAVTHFKEMRAAMDEASGAQPRRAAPEVSYTLTGVVGRVEG